MSWVETLDGSAMVLQRLASVAVTALLYWWSPGVAGVMAVTFEAECLPVDGTHTNFSCYIIMTSKGLTMEFVIFWVHEYAIVNNKIHCELTEYVLLLNIHTKALSALNFNSFMYHIILISLHACSHDQSCQ